jgi:hypothetical protein
MTAKKSSKEAIKEAIRKKVYDPCNQVKLAVTKKEIPEVGILDDKSRSQLKTLLSSYPKDYTFKKNSIYYDVKVSPGNHFKAFSKLAELFESEQLKQFSCFPLRTSFIPCYMTLDSKIIHHHVLKSKKNPTARSKFQTWGVVVDLKKKAFKDQGLNKSLRFQGTIETDGVGVSIIKQNTDTSRRMASINKKKNMFDDETEYIEGLTQAELKNTKGRCVLMDPGRRDLLYCMKETSTAKDKQTLVYTKMTRNKIARHFKILRKKTKPEMIKAAEVILSNTKSSSVDVGNYIKYIKARASVDTLLSEYYGNETQKTKKTYFPDSCFEFHVNNKGDLYFGHLYITRIRGYFPQHEIAPDSSTRFHLYATYLQIMMKQKHISQRLDDTDKAELIKLAAEMFKSNQNNLKQRASELLEKLQVLPFRKLKFSSKLYYKQNDAQLVKKMKNKFGSDSILVLGNWSAPHVRYQEPTRSKGLITMLKKNGFKVYLIDEFKTLSFCPECESQLEKFKIIENPRPYQREKMPTVECHGLLR